MIGRILWTLGAVLLFLFSFWWLALSLAIIGIFIFDRYYESVIIALIIDLVWGLPIIWPFIFSGLVLIIFVLFQSIKNNLLITR